MDSLSQFSQLMHDWKAELLKSVHEDKHFNSCFNSSRKTEMIIQHIVNDFLDKKTEEYLLKHPDPISKERVHRMRHEFTSTMVHELRERFSHPIINKDKKR